MRVSNALMADNIQSYLFKQNRSLAQNPAADCQR